jgi:DNA-binding GntR family transcriptional regulator
MIGTTSLISSQNKKPGQTNFTYGFELPTKAIAKNLKIPETQRVMHVSRVRTADGVPVITSEEYFPEGISGLDYDLEKFKEVDNWSIYGYFSDANYLLNSALTNIHAVSADHKIAQQLEIEEGVPLLCLEQTHYSNESISPLLFCSNYHNDKIVNVLLVRSLSLSK